MDLQGLDSYQGGPGCDFNEHVLHKVNPLSAHPTLGEDSVARSLHYSPTLLWDSRVRLGLGHPLPLILFTALALGEGATLGAGPPALLSFS